MLTSPGFFFKEASLFNAIVRYSDPENRIFNRVISDISVVLRETPPTISDSIQTGSPAESERVREVFLGTVAIT